MSNVILLIQLRKCQEGPITWYEVYNCTDDRPIPIMGQDIEVIQQRVRNIFTHGEILKFDIEGKEG